MKMIQGGDVSAAGWVQLPPSGHEHKGFSSRAAKITGQNTC